MKTLLREMWLFLLLQSVFLAVGGCFLALYGKESLHLSMVSHHHPVADVVFKYVTLLAEGLAVALAVVLLLAHKVRFGAMALLATAGAGMVTQFFKRVVFPDHPRPLRVFEGLADLHLVDGVAMNKALSFPSGHTTAAFALFLAVAVVAKKPVWQVLCFAVALTTAFSRIYLNQHFLQDVMAGSVVGTGVCLVAVFLLRDRVWGDKGLLATFGTNRKRP